MSEQPWLSGLVDLKPHSALSRGSTELAPIRQELDSKAKLTCENAS